MARQQRPRSGSAPAASVPAVAPPTMSPEIMSGLESVRLHGDRDEELYISADDSYFEAAFMTDRIVTAEDNTRFIKKIETLIRSSIEYSRYIAFLRNDLKLNSCSFMSGLDMSEGDIKLEMHHCPLTLYSIVEIVINHRLSRGQAVTSLSVADEVMAMHFEDKIGVVPLATSIHKLVHAGAMSIHPAQVHGDWLSFLRAYPDGVTGDMIANLLAFLDTKEATVIEQAGKVDASAHSPLLRNDSFVPSREEVNMLLMVSGG